MTWAVINVAGEILPGRWESEEEAWELGACGRYLLSGFDVIEVAG